MKHTKSSDALFEAAHELFYRYGIKKATVEDICSRANVSKMTFYRNFKDKNEMAFYSKE